MRLMYKTFNFGVGLVSIFLTTWTACASELGPLVEIEVLTIERFAQEAQSAKDDNELNAKLSAILARPVPEAATTNLKIWQIRGAAALQLNKEDEGREAAYWLLKLEAQNSEQPGPREVLIALNARGWLQDLESYETILGLLSEARNGLLANDFRLAKKNAEAVLGLDPENTHARDLLWRAEAGAIPKISYEKLEDALRQIFHVALTQREYQLSNAKKLQNSDTHYIYSKEFTLNRLPWEDIERRYHRPDELTLSATAELPSLGRSSSGRVQYSIKDYENPYNQANDFNQIADSLKKVITEHEYLKRSVVTFERKPNLMQIDFQLVGWGGKRLSGNVESKEAEILGIFDFVSGD